MSSRWGKHPFTDGKAFFPTGGRGLDKFVSTRLHFETKNSKSYVVSEIVGQMLVRSARYDGTQMALPNGKK